MQEAKEGVGEAVEGSGVRVVSVHRGYVKNFSRRSDTAVSNAQHTPGGVTEVSFSFRLYAVPAEWKYPLFVKKIGFS